LGRADRHAGALGRDPGAARRRGLANALQPARAAARDRRRLRLPALAAPDVRHGHGAAGKRGRAAVTRTLSTPVLRQAPFGEALVALGARRSDVVVLSADLGKYTDVSGFAEAYPERVFQVGMAEANMMGVGGGLA